MVGVTLETEKMLSLGEVKTALAGERRVALSTFSGDNARSRLMPFAFTDDFVVYVPLRRGDLAVLQIPGSPAVSLLSVHEGGEDGEGVEIEVSGKAFLVQKANEKQRARDLLAKRCPDVKEGAEYLRIVPQRVEMRRHAAEGQLAHRTLDFPQNRLVVSNGALLRRKLFAWFLAVRMPFLTASITPIALAGAISWADQGKLSWGLLLLTMLAGAFLHFGVNVINDYFDHLSGNDTINFEFIRPFSGGSRVIQLGLLSPFEMLIGAVVMFAISASIGLYLAAATGWGVLAFGAIGLFCAIFYVGRPFNLAARGVGELAVGLNFGVLMTMGAYYVQTERVDWMPGIAAIPIAVLIAAVLYVNEFPDFAADKAVGKRTWVVRLGRERAAVVYAALMAVPYVAIAIAVAAIALPPETLLAMLTLPLSARAVWFALRFHSQPIDLTPANALTILAHLATGLLLTLAFVWVGSDIGELAYLIGLTVLFTLIVAFVSKGIEQEKQAFLAARGAL